MSERPDRGMTFSEHLDELRKRVLVSVATVFVVSTVAFAYHQELTRFVQYPFERVRASLAAEGRDIGPLVYFAAQEPMLIALRVAFYAGLLIGMPVCLHQMWKFVAAGLYPHERRAVMRVLPASILLFFTGASFAFFVLIPVSLKFLLSFADPTVLKAEIRLSEYMFFFLTFVVMLGLVFQLPLIQVVLARFNLVTPRFMASKRKAFIMGAVVLSAVVTPTTDPWTMSLVAGPLVVLFEIGIVIARRVRPVAPAAEEADPQRA